MVRWGRGGAIETLYRGIGRSTEKLLPETEGMELSPRRRYMFCYQHNFLDRGKGERNGRSRDIKYCVQNYAI